MAERFVVGLSQHGFFWSGWAFTIVGTVAALWIGWIGVSIVFVGMASAMSFAYQKHSEKLAAEKETERVRGLLDDAERKVGELPLETLLRIQQIVAASTVTQVIEGLVLYTEYVERMVQFIGSSKPLSLRTFTQQSGALYAVARVEKKAFGFLRKGDPFILTLKDATGLVTDSARMTVHQLKEIETSASVWFLVGSYLGDEMTHLEALAAKMDVAGLTRYSVRPQCSVERYADFRVSEAAELIRALANEIIQNEGIEK